MKKGLIQAMKKLKQRTNANGPVSHRLHTLWFIVVLLFVALILRLGWIQLGSGEKYELLAEENNFKKIQVVASRGQIYDNSGKLLVGNESLFAAMYLEPDVSKKQKLNTAKNLAKTLNMPLKEVLEAMDVGLDGHGKSVPRKQPPYYPKKIKSPLTEEEIVRISENPDLFPGVNTFAQPLRKYREDTFAVQTIGYVRSFAGAKSSLSKYKKEAEKQNEGGYLDWEQVGMDGLEYSYQDELRGKNGYRLVRVNSSGKLVEVLKEVQPQSGNNLYLTLNEKMQLDAERFIEQHLKSLRSTGNNRAPYAKNAYAVAMEVKTGKIRAMVSYPDYNPNIWNGNVSQEEYRNLSYSIRNGTISEAPFDATNYADPEKEYQRHPLSVLPPGSVFKPLMVWMGLEKGLINPNTYWSDPGKYYYAKATPPVRNSGGHNYGILTPEKALQKSSNTFMAWMGTRWYWNEKSDAVKDFQNLTHQFGLGVKTGVPLKGEQDGSEDFLVTARKYSGLGAMALASFGQAQRYTTMQLAQYTATLANQGKRLKPQLVEKIIDPDSRVTEEIKPEVLNKVDMKPEHWETVVNGMVKVTKPGGTASKLFSHLPFDVAAKTGTSEQDIFGRRVENSVFIAFAPANDPEIAVAVIVPEGGYGAVAAGPIADHLITSYYDQFMKK